MEGEAVVELGRDDGRAALIDVAGLVVLLERGTPLREIEGSGEAWRDNDSACLVNVAEFAILVDREEIARCSRICLRTWRDANTDEKRKRERRHHAIHYQDTARAIHLMPSATCHQPTSLSCRMRRTEGSIEGTDSCCPFGQREGDTIPCAILLCRSVRNQPMCRQMAGRP